jgi:adenylyltransferase/sulfurtransferase
MLSVYAQARLREADLDVRRIGSARVLLKVGDIPEGQVRQHPLWSLARAMRALGFRHIDVCGAAGVFDALDADDSEESCPLVQHPGLWVSDAMRFTAPDADIVVDLSNEQTSVHSSAALAADRSVPFLASGWSRSWMFVLGGVSAAADVRATPAGAAVQPLAPIARMVAGSLLQETLAVLGVIDVVPADPVVLFDAASDSRKGRGGARQWPPGREGAGRVEVIGCGAVGTNLVESLLPMLGPGTEVVLYDPDVVGRENLATQPAFSERDVGRPKAVCLAERQERRGSAGPRVVPRVQCYEQDHTNRVPPALRVSCPDSYSVRLEANRRSMRDGSPLADAGVSPLTAQQRTYVRGQTVCLEHRMQLADRAAVERDRAGCGQAHAATAPGTSMICGGLLAAEALRAMRPGVYGPPSRGVITYDMRFPQRFGVADIRPPCDH